MRHITVKPPESNLRTVSVGPPDQSIGRAAFRTRSLGRGTIFNVSRPITLKSVKIFTQGGGSVAVRLLDPSGAVIASKSFATSAGENRLPLYFQIAPGTGYELDASGTGTDLGMNRTGASYPYREPGVISITGNTKSNTAKVFWFYSWRVSYEEE